MMDVFDLNRFLNAQRSVYDAVLQELSRGEKRGHWMWFIFPQLAGLGKSTTSQIYAIKSTAEARAYSSHPDLGFRLRQCTSIVLDLDGLTARRIFGSIDARKFQSCMTLFDAVTQQDALFSEALAKFFDHRRDQASLRILRSEDR